MAGGISSDTMLNYGAAPSDQGQGAAGMGGGGYGGYGAPPVVSGGYGPTPPASSSTYGVAAPVPGGYGAPPYGAAPAAGYGGLAQQVRGGQCAVVDAARLPEVHAPLCACGVRSEL